MVREIWKRIKTISPEKRSRKGDNSHIARLGDLLSAFCSAYLENEADKLSSTQVSAPNSVILGLMSTCTANIYVQGGGCVPDSIATEERKKNETAGQISLTLRVVAIVEENGVLKSQFW